MGLLTTLRSALVQADFNWRMANIVTTELAIATVVGSCFFWWMWGWQWFFWGLLIFSVFFSFGLCFKFIRSLILTFFGFLWALPFILAATILNIHAAWIGAVVAFMLCNWVHWKAITWSTDLSRTDNDNTVW